MYLSYFDETGDDGYPQHSSDIFVLTSLYMKESDWKDNYCLIQNFRRSLKSTYGLPVKIEFHTKRFLLNKKPYRSYGLQDIDRKKILIEFSNFVPTMKAKIINVVIDKTRIQTSQYPVLENALKYNVQRIENDLSSISSTENFMIISDEGRIASMRKTSRKIQRVNPIPSKFSASSTRNLPIKFLIEDPLSKNSKDSYFIQIVDFVSFVIYHYYLNVVKRFPLKNRFNRVLYSSDINIIMGNLRSIFNLKASSKNKYGYGIVVYP